MSVTIQSKKTFGIGEIIFITFSVLYILAELTFNLGLVEFLNSKNTEIDVFHNLELFGRVLSSIGIALFLTKVLMFFKIKKYIVYISFIGLLFSSLGLQTVIFNKILDNMTAEQKLSAYAFGVYRNLYLNDQTTLKVFNGEDKAYDNTLNSMFGVFSTKDNISDDITNSVKKFFHAENSVDQGTLGKIYDEIQISIPNFDEYYNIYFIESRKFNNYTGVWKEKYRESFKKSIGVEPNLSKEQFIAHFKKEASGADKLQSIVLIPPHPQINMEALTFGDIPEGLNKTEWVAFVNNHINKALDNAKFDAKNIDQLPHSKNIISSVVITPIAVILSLIALVLNIILFVSRWSIIAALLVSIGFGALAFTWNHNPYQLNGNLNKIIGLETRLYSGLGLYRKAIHAMFINDDNPDPYQVIKIEKPKMPDMSSMKSDLDAKFKDLGGSEQNLEDNKNLEGFNNYKKEVIIEEDKLNNENYYGSLRKENPYTKK